MCTLDDFKHLALDKEHRAILENELNLWHRIYLPCGKECQLDLGAGNGETAQFYLNHGVKHVICIEPESELLRANFGKDPRVTIIQRSVDGFKSDCEGGEKNGTIEIHFPYRVKILQRAFPYHGAIVRIEEDWGGPLRKLLRLGLAKIMPRIW